MEESQHKESAKVAEEIQRQFLRAEHVLEGKINAWYQRFAGNNGISMAEARKLLNSNELDEFKWDVQEYIKHGEENAVNHAWGKQLENASAKVHISRLEALKLQVQQEAERLFGNYHDRVDRHILDIYSSRYYHTAFEIQKGMGVGWDFQKLDRRKLELIARKPWAEDGRNFSDRIWSSKDRLVNSLHGSLTRMCITGEAPDRAIHEMSKKMKVSRQQAARLIQTEAAAFSAKAQEGCYKELGVGKFVVVETLDGITCSNCGEMDGKHFPMPDYAIGITAPPFHPNCRGFTCPSFDDGFGSIGKRAARNEAGEVYYVPGDMTYKEWKKSFVDGDKTGLQERGWHGIGSCTGATDAQTLMAFKLSG